MTDNCGVRWTTNSGKPEPAAVTVDGRCEARHPPGLPSVPVFASLQPMLFNLLTQARQALLAQAEDGYCTRTTDKFEKYAMNLNFGTRADNPKLWTI